MLEVRFNSVRATRQKTKRAKKPFQSRIVVMLSAYEVISEIAKYLNCYILLSELKHAL